MTTAASSPPLEPFVLADHPVLDMLNTQAVMDGAPLEFWRSDEDVQAWLERTGWDLPEAHFAKGELLKAALTLREAVRGLVEQRKAGGQGSPDVLNRFLATPSHPRLNWPASGEPRLETVRASATAEQYLAPLAEAAAQLLVEGDFNLVRECEHPDCVLWFYDRTKSHRRRWCSMALCGNRHKVAEFRKRKQQ
ncbi:CGNR zinc finger domain-containing protein [Pseudomonas resinovorans]|uniref:CGNR zinc finger domain-containing protein n=1 Tax=Metapseudomonas resinovorans TaxID=53412 RepID=A0ABT4YAB1_METRE|nr:ABATE domain-containing protein [Pseudomonas resinovorans]MDA8485713.1 CGNR zinc finger domain-containing protein [Pseudomonas resinovorans]